MTGTLDRPLGLALIEWVKQQPTTHHKEQS